MRTYKLYGSDGGVGTNNLANVTVQKNGRIRNLRWAIKVDASAAADGQTVVCELSMASAAQTTTNDTPNVIDQIDYFQNLTTSGATVSGINVSRENMDFPVAAGERIYLHTAAETITGATTATCFVDVEEL